jgi:hypothetical protein
MKLRDKLRIGLEKVNETCAVGSISYSRIEEADVSWILDYHN